MPILSLYKCVVTIAQSGTISVTTIPLTNRIETVGRIVNLSGSNTTTLPPMKSDKNLNGVKASWIGASSVKKTDRTNNAVPIRTEDTVATTHAVCK